MKISRHELNRWDLFSTLGDGNKLEISEFFVFYVHGHGYGALYKTLADDVNGLGWNGEQTNLLGLSGKSFRIEKTRTPIRVDALSGKLIKYFCVDEFVGTALDSNGRIYWWGNFEENEEKIRLPEKIPTQHRFKEVSCGVQMIAGLTLDGDVYVWGCIFGGSEFHVGIPIKLNHPVRAMSCGGHHVAIIAQNGLVYTWGDGSWGQRGYSNYLKCDELLVRRVLLDDVISIKCGVWCSYFLTHEGQLWTCGQNDDLGVLENCERDEEDDTVPRPSRVDVPPSVIDLGVAWESDLSIVAAQTAGSLYSWGNIPVQEVAMSSYLVTAFLGVATPHDQGLIHVDQSSSITA